MNARGGRPSTADGVVTCIACGAECPRSAAREYDRAGDRWSRADKRFEYLCKPCHRDCCHQPRDGLEAALVDAGAGEVDDATFLARYCEAAGDERTERDARG